MLLHFQQVIYIIILMFFNYVKQTPFLKKNDFLLFEKGKSIGIINVRVFLRLQ